MVELMVVVAVMAVLASVAYPLYTSQVQKSRRADAKIALQTVAAAQERFYTVNGRYAVTLASLQVSSSIQDDAESDKGYYAISLAQDTTQDFTATASAAAGGPQAGDADCPTFTLNHLGVQTPVPADDDDPICW